MLLKEERALEAYAAMMNSLDASILEPLLAENFRYASQWVLEEIDSKTEYLNYIVPKLEAIRESGSSVWAEMGWINREFSQPCVIMAQGDRDDLVAVVFAKVEEGKIKRLDLCCVPAPTSAHRTGRYPALTMPHHAHNDPPAPKTEPVDVGDLYE